MNASDHLILRFPAIKTKSGILTMFQHGENAENVVPFKIKKVLIIKGMNRDDVRGGHTHHKTQQILICIKGGCRVNLDNGKSKTSVVLNNAEKGLLLPPYVWHTMDHFKKDTILMVIADTEYDEKEYIRDYDKFLQCVNKKPQ